MKYGKFLPIILILIVLLAGFGIWQRTSTTKTKVYSESQNTTQTKSQNTNTSSFIEQLRQKEFKGGKIKVEETLSNNDTFTSYIFSYPSENLKIYGMMNIPKGNGPFPVIILNHGYYNPSSFKSGDGTKTMADILARNGYLTMASDYRGHGKSEGQGGGHRPDYALDVLNLLASLKSVDKADASRTGMWGHSMGGETTLRTIEATDQVEAVALWAPTSANASDNANFYSRGRSATTNPEPVGISPINYLKYISAPISLHQGLSDTEVKPEWSRKLDEALKKEGKTVDYFEYEGQDHNFRNLGWDLISKRTLAFYDKYLNQ